MRILLLQHVFGELPGAFSVQMEREVELPFLPTAGCSLGLCEDSGFRWNEHTVKRAMWNVPRNMGYCELEEIRLEDPLQCVKWMIENEGWKVHLEMPINSLEEAMQICEDNEDSDVIEMDGLFFSVSQTELTCLKLDGREFVGRSC